MLRISLFVSTFLLTLAACLWATVALSRGPIERDLTSRSVGALEGLEGYREDFCLIEFEGRDGLIRGEVKSPELKRAVEERLRDLNGPRVIESELIVRPYDAPWIMVERASEGGIRVAGLLSDEGERRQLSSELKEAIAAGTGVDLQVEVRDRVEPAEWMPRLLGVAGELMPVAEGGVLELRDGRLSLGGEMPDPDAERAFVGRANEQFAGAGIDLEFALTIAPPPQPAHFRMSPPHGGEITVSGRLADLKAAEELLAVLRSGGDWIVNDEIVVAEDTTAAPWVEGLTYLLPSLLIEAREAAVSLEGGRLQLDGQLESAEMLEAISEVTQQNFPTGDYVVENRMQVVEPPQEAMVSVITYPDGRIELKGLLPEPAQKERVIRAVEEIVGGGLLSDQLLVEANVMEAPWMDSLVGLLPRYVKQVKRGGLTIYAEILAVEAVIESDSDRDLIWALTEQFFPDDHYRRILELRFPEEVAGSVDAEDEFPNNN